jgi:hypothetical protein
MRPDESVTAAPTGGAVSWWLESSASPLSRLKGHTSHVRARQMPWAHEQRR